MRIIAGKLKGLNFSAPNGAKTHPMSDRVRGGLFNTLGDIEGLEVLDVFCGSGALSFEAVSRGASQAWAIESDNKAYKTVKQNINKLKLDKQIKVSCAYAKSWLNNNPDKTYDLILADPPYDDLSLSTIEMLSSYLKPNGVLALSWPGKLKPLILAGLEIVQNKNYGDAQLVFYRKIS